jgi:hypothetical protein
MFAVGNLSRCLILQRRLPVVSVVTCLSAILAFACGGAVESERGSQPGAGGAIAGGSGGGAGKFGGAGGVAGGGAAPGSASCPSGLPGPNLVAVPHQKGAFCVDATEVTERHYGVFLADAAQLPPPANRPECAWNDGLEPPFGWPSTPEDLTDLPVSNVDWCDAAAYCSWAGKRLCWSVHGQPLSYDGWLDDVHPAYDVKLSEWYLACSSDGTYTFGYGNTPDAGACRNATHQPWGPIAVGTMSGCTAPGQAGLFDMSGNMAEWEDACEDALGPDDPCLVRGGDYTTPVEAQACIKAWPQIRATRSPHVGIRCCTDTL